MGSIYSQELHFAGHEDEYFRMCSTKTDGHQNLSLTLLVPFYHRNDQHLNLGSVERGVITSSNVFAK